MKKIRLLLLLTFLIPILKVPGTFVLAAESMRHCMLLPIIETPENKMSFKVFEEVEAFLKESTWCTYKSNSELINLLSTYSKNFESHLKNKDVLKVVSDKTKSGTMIRIEIVDQIQGLDVSVEVVAENGEDIYFKEKTLLKTKDEALVARTIKNWLDVYEKTIPYDGRIKGVLGDQFTIDIGKKSLVFNGNEIVIERPIGKRRHPLLKEITDYETEKIAEAKVFDVNDTQAQARVTQYESNKKLRLEDWVKVRSESRRKVVEEASFDDEKKEAEVGKLGQVGIMLTFGPSSVDASGTNTRAMDGILYGVDLETEIWATRNYWLGIDLSQKIGTYSKDTGTFASDTNKTNNSVFRLKAAYKYLPLGFFYGPQVDFYAGYGKFTYGMQTQTTDKFTEFTFSGLMLGARGSMPLIQDVRIYLTFDFHLTSSFKEKVTMYGGDESSSHYRLEAGGQYQYAPNMLLTGGFNILSNKANFASGATKELQFKDFSAKFGAIFSF